jgi:UDP-N-acetylmuramate dehydrogenase
MVWETFLTWLRTETTERIAENEPMSLHTNWRIGGPARAMYWPRDLETCSRVLQKCRQNQIKTYFLGNGSNLLVSDQGLDGLVINTRELQQVSWQEDQVQAGSGVSLALLASQASRRGLQGMAFAIGIPGTVGGAVLMNAGAYGSAMSDIVTSVVALDESGEMHFLSAADLHYSYRHSYLQEKGWLIGQVNLTFQRGDQASIESQMNEYLQSRKEKQPLEYPNGGSVFKNPTGQGAGRLIEAAGLKGLRVGDAQISLKHANFIVNLGEATAQDVLTLIKTVKETMQEKSGVQLDTEVVYWR